MKGINQYWKQLTAEQIAAGEHRQMVGGLWDELGRLQFEFLVSRGLLPSHRLVDVGCGALRAGLHFVRYLEPAGYCGLDVNESLIAAGKRELEAAGLADRGARLLVDDRFAARRFEQTFDFALAHSLFTHLPMNAIVRCLVEVRAVLRPQGSFFASFFEAPRSAHLEPIVQPSGHATTQYDANPFHQSIDEMRALAAFAEMQLEAIGDYGHPRGQRMLRFHRA